jgi:hypothetical protein
VKIFVPIALAILGAFALSAILFVLVRNDAMPARLRAFDWRKATVVPPAEPVEGEAV